MSLLIPFPGAGDDLPSSVELPKNRTHWSGEPDRLVSGVFISLRLISAIIMTGGGVSSNQTLAPSVLNHFCGCVSTVHGARGYRESKSASGRGSAFMGRAREIPGTATNHINRVTAGWPRAIKRRGLKKKKRKRRRRKRTRDLKAGGTRCVWEAEGRSARRREQYRLHSRSSTTALRTQTWLFQKSPALEDKLVTQKITSLFQGIPANNLAQLAIWEDVCFKRTRLLTWAKAHVSGKSFLIKPPFQNHDSLCLPVPTFDVMNFAPFQSSPHLKDLPSPLKPRFPIPINPGVPF